MVGTVRTKRRREREDKHKNVKRKGELFALEIVVITNMEPFCLDVCWSSKQQREFKLADLYEFWKWSSNLSTMDVPLVAER